MDYDTPLFFHVMQYAADADRDVVDMVSGNPDWGSPDAISAAVPATYGAAADVPLRSGPARVRASPGAVRSTDPVAGSEL